MKALLLVLSLLVLAGIASTAKVESQATKLNVHIIAHTHDDVGWLKTVDEYYYGANNTIQDARVQYILDSVVQALLDNPDRRFIYVEIAFFYRWWNEQTEYKKQQVRDLVRDGRLEFINGGWCMNDEATTHYESIIDQMTIGHQFLLREFGIMPKAGWHIDPFGHSNMHPVLFGMIGFDSFFFSRIDYQDFAWRIPARQLELVWRGSQSFGSQLDTWTSIIKGGYCGSFLFEWSNTPPVQDDPNLFNVNTKWWADHFNEVVQGQAMAYRTNEILIPLGCDFAYSNANINFKNMDKLMNYMNSHPEYNMNVFYSTPSIYAEAVHSHNLTWDVKTDDFFPYADEPHAYWTGYFTSRSALKGYVRSRNALLKATEMMMVSTRQTSNAQVAQLDILQRAQGVAQHHDAVAGTEQQHVAYDYAERLSIGSAAAEGLLTTIAAGKLSPSDNPKLALCPLANESICPATNVLTQNAMSVPVVVYNSLAWARQRYITVPVPTTSVKVVNDQGSPVTYQVQNIGGNYSVVFRAQVTPLGYSTYFIVGGSSETEVTEETHVRSSGPITLQNGLLTVSLDATGKIQAIKDASSGASVQVTQDYLYYVGHTDANNEQASGAYIFRPAKQTPSVFGGNPNPSVYTFSGPLVQGVRRVFSEELSQIIRLYAGEDHLEIEDIVGPIDVSDGNGKEVVTRYTTNLATNATWFTDSNGMEMQQRWRNYRPTWKYSVNEPVSGNYFPMNAIAYIKDDSSQVQFTVMSDRSRSASSIQDGQLETMLHRRLLYDDGRGVGEALDEKTRISTKEWIIVKPSSSSARSYRQLTKELAHPLLPLFGQTNNYNNWVKNYKLTWSPMSAALPINVQLVNLKPNQFGEVILRVHHIYQKGEDSQLAQPVTIDLQSLFTNQPIVYIQEMNLSAVKKISDIHRLHWNTASTTTTTTTTTKPISVGKTFGAPIPVTLQPMAIRTFLVRFSGSTEEKVVTIN